MTVHPDLFALVWSAAGLLGLVGLGEGARAWGGLSAEASRRLVHAGVGLFVAITPYIFTRPDLVYVLAGIFVVANYAALRRGLFPGIHGIARRSLGTVTFPMALVPALVVCWTVDPDRLFALQIAFVILALADPLASIVGSRSSGRAASKDRATKTIAGSLAFGSAALLVGGGGLAWFKAQGLIDWRAGEVVLAAVLVGAVTAAVEALGRRGWDNFFVILAAIAVLVVFDERPASRLLFGAAAGAGVLFGVGAYRAGFLNAGGALAGGLLAASVIGLGGWGWAVPSFTFFFLSSLLSRVGRSRKAAVEAISEKGSRRDAGQVYANGGVGWILLVGYAFFPLEAFYWGFLGAFAAATADTWGTEIGGLSRRAPRLITTWRVVPRGTSGAVSLRGTLGALAGAGAVFLSAGPFLGTGIEHLGPAAVVVILGGVLGSIVDSLTGATVQARFRDPRTGRETERASSPDGPHPLIRGWRWLRNDQVNWVCTASGAAFAMACFQAANFSS